MKKRIVFVLNTMGWLLLMLAFIMGAVYAVGSNYKLYYKLQMKENAAEYAGISSEDMLILDKRLSDYLFTPMNADAALDNREIEVYGKMQPPFNERELIHLHDCRALLSLTAGPANYIVLIAAGAALVICAQGNKTRAAWAASAAILLPLLVFGVWAAVDFRSAFAFFHRLLFSNDLWLLNPETDLLIRICPASMFASLGMRMGLYSAGVIAGIPALLTLCNKIADKRKRI